MKPLRYVMRPLAYAWALPTTAFGLVAAGLTLATGGKAQLRQGAIEIHGGFATWFLGRRVVSAQAMTLGHVILGRDTRCLDSCRDHEQAHVRQVEAWGPFFLPAYIGASVWAQIRKRHYYLDNWFEVDARRATDEVVRRRALGGRDA